MSGTGEPWKKHPFLDDPLSYPEYSILVKRQGLHHRVRLALHNHRTAALVTLVAVAIKLSGAATPCIPSFSCDGDETTVFDWTSFLSKGLALELLSRHFDGLGSAIACMSVTAATSLLAFPLVHYVAPAAATLPPILGWALAVWGAGKFRWGIASGLGVGMFAACVTLKTVSFAHQIRGGISTTFSDKHAQEGLAERSSASSNTGADGSAPQAVSLTFAEFAYFMLTAPSLLCKPACLQRSARRPCRLMRAASEFFHSGLCFLVLHASLSAITAPALRVIARTFFSGGAESEENTSDWMDLDGWAVIAADGNGGWLPGGGRWIEFGVAMVTSMLVTSPMVHFTMFYGFWHCVCLGLAELWGYPDRNLYGPWWLITDDFRAFYRLWSLPVHRWMSCCIYRPVLEFGDSNGGSAKAVGGGKGNAHTDNMASRRRWQLVALLAVFSCSSLGHEIILFVGMRKTCWPFHTFFLITSALKLSRWDSSYPVLSYISDKSEDIGDLSSIPPPASRAVLGKRKVKVGSEWRGWRPVAFYMVISAPFSVVTAFLGWQWWRHAVR